MHKGIKLLREISNASTKGLLRGTSLVTTVYLGIDDLEALEQVADLAESYQAIDEFCSFGPKVRQSLLDVIEDRAFYFETHYDDNAVYSTRNNKRKARRLRVMARALEALCNKRTP